MFKLIGKIQHYPWGGTTFISTLLGIVNATNEAYAEYWMGAHPNAPSFVEQSENQKIPLDKLIAGNPEYWLGKQTAERFGRLPFLLKVLDVKEMLSIQVHPSKQEAEKGFARESEAGIPVNAPHRNYKDDNHKPEMMLALSEFWLLHGFKTKERLLQTLNETQAFKTLAPLFEKEGYYGLYKYVMQLPQASVDDMLNPLLQEASLLYQSHQLPKSDPAYWACKVLPTPEGPYRNIDRGIFSIYFFNLIRLHPGQAIFQGAGVPHAYLEGQNMELMSNSDNVLRGGLTSKHVDVPELLTHTLFEGITPRLVDGEKRGWETIFPCPVSDFVLSRIALSPLQSYRHIAFSAEILHVADGEIEIVSGLETVQLKKGETVFIRATEDYFIRAHTNTILYKAAVPE
ncbi:MAG: mannose-6-phosphate isomerase, class I [Chitinophagaceae bacterium]|nr:mannose-6-phosphate isomerase, class I [Chitinophagaceae bacterium]